MTPLLSMWTMSHSNVKCLKPEEIADLVLLSHSGMNIVLASAGIQERLIHTSNFSNLFLSLRLLGGL